MTAMEEIHHIQDTENSICPLELVLILCIPYIFFVPPAIEWEMKSI